MNKINTNKKHELDEIIKNTSTEIDILSSIVVGSVILFGAMLIITIMIGLIGNVIYF